jgi:hypothetical protein
MGKKSPIVPNASDIVPALISRILRLFCFFSLGADACAGLDIGIHVLNIFPK